MNGKQTPIKSAMVANSVNTMVLFIFSILICFNSMGQVVKDTSFTIHSSYVKEKKRFPSIGIPIVAQPENVLVKKDVVYRTIGDRQLLADIYYPIANTDKKRPAVLMIFGGGWKSGNKNQWQAYGYRLAEKGYVAIAVEYRLSPEANYPAAVHDLKAAVRWIRAHAKQYRMDKAKIAAMGASAGGQLASLLGTTNGKKKFNGKEKITCRSAAVNAVINIDGILAFKHPESVEGKVAGEWLGGLYEEKPKLWEEASPLTHVDKRAAPTCFINSSNPRFHAGRTDMITQFDSLHIYSEVHEMPNTPHTFWLFHPWFNDVVDHSISFLKKVMK